MPSHPTTRFSDRVGFYLADADRLFGRHQNGGRVVVHHDTVVHHGAVGD